jgi:hypothetical protein
LRGRSRSRRTEPTRWRCGHARMSSVVSTVSNQNSPSPRHRALPGLFRRSQAVLARDWRHPANPEHIAAQPEVPCYQRGISPPNQIGRPSCQTGAEQANMGAPEMSRLAGKSTLRMLPLSDSVMNSDRPSWPPNAQFVVPRPRGDRTTATGRPSMSCTQTSPIPVWHTTRPF